MAFYIPFWLHKQKPANFGLLSQRPGRFAMIKTGNFLGAINEDFDSFEDNDGCPDNDNDTDGILDVNDQCPNEVETKNQKYYTDIDDDL